MITRADITAVRNVYDEEAATALDRLCSHAERAFLSDNADAANLVIELRQARTADPSQGNLNQRAADVIQGLVSRLSQEPGN